MEALGLDPESINNLGADVLQQVLLGHFMVDYWINLAVCHSLIVEDHPDLGKVYQVPCQCIMDCQTFLMWCATMRKTPGRFSKWPAHHLAGLNGGLLGAGSIPRRGGVGGGG